MIAAIVVRQDRTHDQLHTAFRIGRTDRDDFIDTTGALKGRVDVVDVVRGEHGHDVADFLNTIQDIQNHVGLLGAIHADDSVDILAEQHGRAVVSGQSVQVREVLDVLGPDHDERNTHGMGIVGHGLGEHGFANAILARKQDTATEGNLGRFQVFLVLHRPLEADLYLVLGIRVQDNVIPRDVVRVDELEGRIEDLASEDAVLAREVDHALEHLFPEELTTLGRNDTDLGLDGVVRVLLHLDLFLGDLAVGLRVAVICDRNGQRPDRNEGNLERVFGIGADLNGLVLRRDGLRTEERIDHVSGHVGAEEHFHEAIDAVAHIIPMAVELLGNDGLVVLMHQDRLFGDRELVLQATDEFLGFALFFLGTIERNTIGFIDFVEDVLHDALDSGDSIVWFEVGEVYAVHET